MVGEDKFPLPDARLDRIERRLSDYVHRMRTEEEFSQSLNIRIIAQMFTLVVGGRKIKKNTLDQYKKALARYKLDPERDYFP